MATTPADELFLDTNILLTATTPARDGHELALRILEGWPRRDVDVCISGQIVREYLAVATRPAMSNGLGLSLDDALRNVAAILGRTRLLEEDRAVLQRLCELLAEVSCTGRQVHDANVVATMTRHGVRNLVTADGGDFARFADRIDILELSAAGHLETGSD